MVLWKFDYHGKTLVLWKKTMDYEKNYGAMEKL